MSKTRAKHKPAATPTAKYFVLILVKNAGIKRISMFNN